MNHRITANLITLNEASNLDACLSRLAWVDEIVVVDGGSSDRTVEIARRYTGNVHVHPFDNFASQRNRAIEQSSGDWIFSLDADERVSAALASEIHRSVQQANSSTWGFWVPIQSRIFGRRFRFSGTQGERKMRLFRRGLGRWISPIHETVSFDALATPASIAPCYQLGRLRCAIDHHSTPDLETYLKKLVRYSALESERLARSGPLAGWRPWAVPLWTFVKLYFARLGVFDGREGLRFCMLSAMEKWIEYQQAIERQRKSPNGQVAGRHFATPSTAVPFVASHS